MRVLLTDPLKLVLDELMSVMNTEGEGGVVDAVMAYRKKDGKQGGRRGLHTPSPFSGLCR